MGWQSVTCAVLGFQALEASLESRVNLIFVCGAG